MFSEKNKLRLGISPCPNDTFMFDALLHDKIDTEGLEFECALEDVESLNKKALQHHFDISKISFYTLGQTQNHYQLLSAGAAMGHGVGPLFVCHADRNPETHPIQSVAIPGKYTTANFLFSLFFPDLSTRKEMMFSEIEDAVVNGSVDAGVIIHESRFTYQEKGLRKIADLGDLWEHTTSSPIPLGGIIMRQSFPDELKQKVNRVLRRSIQFAFDHPEDGMEFIRSHAQSMNDEVIKKHIQLYVSEASLHPGAVGKSGIRKLFEMAGELGIQYSLPDPLFIE